MIRSFADKATRDFFDGRRVARFQAFEKQAFGKLRILNRARGLEDLRALPGLHLHKLIGDLKDYWAIRINKQYRIIFTFEAGDAEDVQIIDYHD